MLKGLLFIIILLLASVSKADVAYYYFTMDGCASCRVVNRVIVTLPYDIEIINNGSKLPIRSYPTIVITISGRDAYMHIEEILKFIDARVK